MISMIIYTEIVCFVFICFCLYPLSFFCFFLCFLTSFSVFSQAALPSVFAEPIAMADWGSFLNKSSGSGGRSMMNEDFDEEDSWGLNKERAITRVSKESSGSSSARRIPTSPRKIPRATSITHTNVVQGSSAPVDIPDWSKIYGMNCKKGSRNGSLVDVGESVSNKGDCGYGDHYYDDCGDDDDDDEDGDKGDMIPPHEWIARKLARSQISSFSVCEGIGRTLKGRDLSKVRTAILTKTGFIE